MRCMLLAQASVFAIILSAVPATTASAQQATPPAAGANQTAPDDTDVTQTGNPTQIDDNVNADGSARDQAGDITVTGSRIRLPNVEGFEPTTTLTRQYIDERGITNVADAINELPGIRGSITPAGAQGSFGQGVNFINNFGLGSNRTLTLVNGRRFVSSNVPTLFNQGSQGTQVDLNVIPTQLVERLDIVSVGGAPIYGSDAIAGTVNVILKTNFTGLTLTGTSGISEQGDAFRYNLGAVGGFNFADDRGNLSFSYSHDQQDGLLFNSRDFLRLNNGGVTNPSTSQAAALGRAAGITFANDGRVNTGIGFNDSQTDGFPGTIVARDVTLSFLTGGGLITAANNAAGTSLAGVVRNFQFDRSGSLIPFNRGIPFVGQNSSGGDGFRFNDYSQITSDVRRDIANGFFKFDFSRGFKVFAEGTYFHSRGDELVQQPTFNSSLFAGLSSALTFDVNSAFLTPQARAELISRGVNTFQVSRASLDLADPTGFSTNDVYRIVGGAKGDFTFGGRDFNYEISGNYGRTDVTDSSQDLNAQNFINAVNVTRNAAGQVVCTATPTRQAAPGGTAIADAACVPLNLLGEGLSDPAARAYVISTNITKSRLQQTVFNANMGGSPFDLFGNKTGFNIGYEHREEKGTFTPSDFQQRGLGRSVGILPVSGKYNVDEVFGEILLPIVTPQNGLGFLNNLEIFGRGRYVDNTVNGGFFAWAAGGRVSPIRDITFRGNYTKSFRAPAITELFQPISNAFASVPDLCSPANIGAGAAPATRRANCTAFLAAFPNATPLDAATATVPSRSGGNPNLDNEVAYSFTYGVVLQPRFIPGLSLAVDYTNIKIRNPISNLAVATIASACFDNASFNTADPANGNEFCSRLQRYARGQGGTAANGGDRGGQVIADPANPGVTAGFVNGNRIKYDGIIATIDYFRPLSGLGLPGRAGFDGTLNYTRTRIVDITGVAPVRTDGVIGDPTWQGQITLRYAGEGFGFASSFNYIGEQLFSRATRGADIREVDKLADFVTINPSIYFDVNDRFRFTFSVSNVTNRSGQDYFGIILPASYTDLIGRRFAVTARARF